MANTVTNVSAGKPAISGGIWRAPLGTTLPTDATTALGAAFKCFGYIGEDGVTNSQGLSTENYKAWGGDVVLNYVSEWTDTFNFNLAEILNDEVYKVSAGDTAVTGDLTTGLTVTYNGQDRTASVYVIEVILRGGALKRIVIPNGQVSEIGDVQYVDNSPVLIPVTITAMADSNGNTHYEYIKKAA